MPASLGTNKPEYLIVHHTGGSDINPLQDSSNFTFAQCNDLHKNNPNVNLGYPSTLGYYIGYHYYIDKAGTVTQGRADTEEGAHTVGKNRASIGICLAGNFDATLPTAAQVSSLTALLKRLQLRYEIPTAKIVPHRTFANKTCYGRKLTDDWAQKLVASPAPAPVKPTQMTNAEIVAKAEALIQEAMALLSQLR